MIESFIITVTATTVNESHFIFTEEKIRFVMTYYLDFIKKLLELIHILRSLVGYELQSPLKVLFSPKY